MPTAITWDATGERYFETGLESIGNDEINESVNNAFNK